MGNDPAAAGAPARTHATIVLAIALAVVATGCGSTVHGTEHPGSSAQLGSAPGNGLAAPPAAASGTSASTAAALPVGSSASTSPGPAVPGASTPGAGTAAPASASGGASTATGQTSGSPPASGDATTGSSPDPGQGGTQAPPEDADGDASNQPVTIGVMTLDTSNMGSGFGVDITTGDVTAQSQALADWINGNGGAGGREVHIDVFEADTGQASNGQQQVYEQAACARWTEDIRVEAVVSQIGDTDVLRHCLAQAGVAYLNMTGHWSQAESDALGGLEFAPSALLLERHALTEADAFADLVTGQKVGIMTHDTPEITWVLNEVLIPRLEAHGAEVVEVEAGQSIVDNANQQNTVLRFRAAEVTVVVTFVYNPVFFATAAESQAYRPTYALTSASAPNFVASAAPTAQMEGARLMGYQPVMDLAVPQDTDTPAPGDALCRQIMDDAGQDTSNATTYSLMTFICDGFFFADAAWDASGEVTGTGIRQGAPAAEAAFASPATFATSFPAGRNDGVTAYRDGRYDSACTCFRYTSGLKEMAMS